MKKIVILQDIPSYMDEIKKVVPDWDVVFTKNKDEAREHLKEAEIVFDWNDLVKELCLDSPSPLKWIHAVTAGVDYIPMRLLKEKNVMLTNAKGVHPKQMAETIFAAMLALTRCVPIWVNAQNDARWSFNEVVSSEGLGEIHGKTIGILGAGVIGSEVAKIARAFSMYTIGLRRTDNIAPYVDEMYTYDKLHEVLSRCDYVINLMPLTKETKGIINAEAFNSMRTGCSYYAFGRGATTDETALVEALKTGKLASAGLDVFEVEPLPKNSPLWAMKNVLISPHMAGKTPYYNDRVMEIFIANLKDYVQGKELSHSRVDLDLEY